MISDEQLKLEGVKALTAALGDIQAERFIALIQRAPFDYTFWRQKLWTDQSVSEISQAAMILRQSESSKHSS